LYDVTIIGSGIGGLLCATFLAKEGMKVCVIEKNKQLGGNLQTFSRDKQLFDTGVHYLGGLNKGQNLHQIFKYAGLIPRLNLKKMDDGFDKILLQNDETVYTQAQGYEAFQQNLIKDFPEETVAIEKYCELIHQACSAFPLYHLTLEGNGEEKLKYTAKSARKVIESLTSNKKLQAVLSGNNLLYAGVAGKTPFHIHALIINSYIESSWKCVDGGSQIVKILVAKIRQLGGEMIRNKTVARIVEKGGFVTHVDLDDGSSIQSKFFISNVNPAATLQMVDSPFIKKNYRNRIQSLQNTVSSFSLYIVLKEKTIPYQNCNYYYHKEGNVWSADDYNADEWPLAYGLYFTEDKKHSGFASAISVLTLMKFVDVSKWSETIHTTRFEHSRGEKYETFKLERSEKLLTLVYERFPELQGNIRSHYAATPLTNRDYIGMSDGSIYGIQKDFNDPLKSTISPRTKISNLFLTGQNINLHGILGTSLSAILTCTMLLDSNNLVDKIRNA